MVSPDAGVEQVGDRMMVACWTMRGGDKLIALAVQEIAETGPHEPLMAGDGFAQEWQA
ncbi:MAG: hypothetical protein R6X02_33790 [Enhygromyxa sp.]